MVYVYENVKDDLFTDEGQRMFLKIRDWINQGLDKTGAVRMDKILKNAGSGISWTMLACVDRLVELKEIREITGTMVPQHRVFVRSRVC